MSLLDYKSFLNESKLNEAKAPASYKQPFYDAYAKLFPRENDPKNTKSGEVIRAKFGLDGMEAEENIKKMFAEAGLSVSSIQSHIPGTVRDGDRKGSDEYYTYEVKSGPDTFFVTNSAKTTKSGGVQEIGRKVVGPANLGLNGVYKDAGSLIRTVEGAIKSVNWMKPSTKDVLINLARSAGNVKPRFNNMKEFFDSKNFSDFAALSSDLESLDPASLQNVINDFGEILDGIYVLSSVRNIKDGLEFPEESNRPLLDIICDGYMISSKDVRGGGSPSAAPVIAALNDPELTLDQGEKDLASILTPIIGKGVYEQYMSLADSLLSKKSLSSNSAYQHLLSVMGRSSRPSQSDLEKYLTNLSDDDYIKLVSELEAKSGRQAKKPALDAKKRIGPVFVNITKECGDTLNKQYQEAFSSITTKVLSLKQIYLAIKIKDKKMEFTSKSSDIMQAKFETSKSTPENPFNAGLSFKFMKGR
jgi:hypothetical protein